MKKLILLAGVAMLAACDNKADDAVVADDTMADDTVMVDETAAAPMNYAGSFEVTSVEGEAMGTTTTNADGTYIDTNPDGSTASGTWRLADDGKLCFDEDGEDPEKCWTAGEVTDGKTKWTSDTGDVVMAVHTPAA